jgi:hypothetical protein
MAETYIEHGKDILDTRAIEKANGITVYDAGCRPVLFKNLFNDADKTLLVFIRHFYCGACQAQVALANVTGKETPKAN